MKKLLIALLIACLVLPTLSAAALAETVGVSVENVIGSWYLQLPPDIIEANRLDETLILETDGTGRIEVPGQETLNFSYTWTGEQVEDLGYKILLEGELGGKVGELFYSAYPGDSSADSIGWFDITLMTSIFYGREKWWGQYEQPAACTAVTLEDFNGEWYYIASVADGFAAYLEYDYSQGTAEEVPVTDISISDGTAKLYRLMLFDTSTLFGDPPEMTARLAENHLVLTGNDLELELSLNEDGTISYYIDGKTIYLGRIVTE